MSLIDFLLEIEQDYVPTLSNRLDIVQYAEKLQSHATFGVAQELESSQIIGIIAFYCNDPLGINAYLPIIGISKEARGRGIGRKLFNDVLVFVQKMRFLNISMQTWEGHRALGFYKSCGFKVVEMVQDRPNNLHSLKMKKVLE